MHILVIEDDAALASYIRKSLESEHYTVDVALDGEQGALMASDLNYDLLVLDLNLPKLDGISVLRNLRPDKPQLPILVLTARPRVEDRVLALDSGADDCINKPFSYSELSARMRALLRRGRPSVEAILRIADLCLDRVERKVQRGGRSIELTTKEFALLEYLMRNAGRRITRSMIIEHVWNISFDTSTNVVDVYINYLRKKVDDGALHRLIHTVRGVGYELCSPSFRLNCRPCASAPRTYLDWRDIFWSGSPATRR
jgi:DNA-binding response OmpR family regulator